MTKPMKIFEVTLTIESTGLAIASSHEEAEIIARREMKRLINGKSYSVINTCDYANEGYDDDYRLIGSDLTLEKARALIARQD